MATPAATEEIRPAWSLVAEKLYLLGGCVELDGRITWAPASCAAYQPASVFVLKQDTGALLIDTGLAAQRQSILEQLSALVPQGEPLSILMMRPEYDSMGNLEPLVRSRPIATVYGYGSARIWDPFDDVSGPLEALVGTYVPLSRVALGESVLLSETSQLQILAAPLRILPTYWAYDPATKTLFTSDVFTHNVLSSALEPPLVTAGSDTATLESVRAHLFAKFHWLDKASTVAPIIDQLDDVFARHDVANIAPAHGAAIVGKDLSERHYQLVRRVLADISGGHPSRSPAPQSFPLEQATVLKNEPKTVLASSPREIAKGIYWLGGCNEKPRTFDQRPFHAHISSFLVVGTEATALVDTSPASHWTVVRKQLDEILGDRQLDWIFPTHPEPPHSSNILNLLPKYPNAQVVGDVRDLHVCLPDYADCLVPMKAGDTLDLGGGHMLEFVAAPLKDLPSTLWAWERSQRVLFVADAFALQHAHASDYTLDDDDDMPIHLPDECRLLVSELPVVIGLEQVKQAIAATLNWTQYVDCQPLIDEVLQFVHDRDIRMFASAHGNVVDDIPTYEPTIRAAHASALADTNRDAGPWSVV